MTKHEWATPLGQKMFEFLELKRLSGYKYEWEGRLLERFDDFCAANQYGAEIVTQEIAEGFIYGVPYEKTSTHYVKEKLLRNFGKYLCDLGHESYVCPKKANPKRSDFTPYIFTEAELHAFFKAVDQYPAHHLSNRHLVDPLLFRLVYGCGLRITEALSIGISDVDTENGTLTILHAKNDKNRIVPMAESLRLRCEAFKKAHLLSSPDEKIFLHSPQGGILDKSTVYRRFREYLWAAGISHSGSGPRIHDFRHTYCVHRMKKWVLDGKDLLNLLPYLSIYLGHADFRGTQYYLRLTADLYPDIIRKEEAVLCGIFPDLNFASGSSGGDPDEG